MNVTTANALAVKSLADAGYRRPKFQQGLARICRQVNVEVVRRCDTGKFVVLPKRWIVARTIAWLTRCRRLGNDWKCLYRKALIFVRWASMRMMLRRLCRTKNVWPAPYAMVKSVGVLVCIDVSGLGT